MALSPGLALVPGLAVACPSGFESEAALVRAARCIVGVAVEAVSEAPPRRSGTEAATDESTRAALAREDAGNRRDARAQVKVVETLRGTCAVKRFALVGGPYQTCAPFDCYLSFRKGDRLFLLLDRPLPDDTETVVVTWRCRVFGGDKEELQNLLDSTAARWSRAVDLHRELFPAAMARAEGLLPGWRREKPEALRPGVGYSELACLRLLLCDPAHLGPSRSGAGPSPEPGVFSGLSRGAGKAPPAAPGVFLTDHHTTPWQVPELDQALAARAKARPEEVVDFNQVLLQGLLAKELALGDELAGRVVDEAVVAGALGGVQPSPLSFDIVERDAGDKWTKLLESASWLLVMADDECDRMVWRGLAGKTEPELDPRLFLPLLEGRAPSAQGSVPDLDVLWRMPDPRVVPYVKGFLRREEGIYRVPGFFRYFLRANDEAGCLECLDAFARLAAEELRAAPDDGKVSATEWIAGRLRECRQAASKARPRSEPVMRRLRELARAYPEPAGAADPSEP